MYSIHGKGKFVVAKIFIRNLKNKMYKYMTWISKNDIVNKYDNTYRRTIKMKSADVKPGHVYWF